MGSCTHTHRVFLSKGNGCWVLGVGLSNRKIQMAEIFAQFSKNMPYWCRSKCSMNCDSLVWTYPEACSDNRSFSFPELGLSGEREQHRREGLCFLFLLCPIFFLLFLILLFSQHCLPQSPKLNMVHQRKKQQRNGKRGLYLCSSLQKMLYWFYYPHLWEYLFPAPPQTVIPLRTGFLCILCSLRRGTSQ